MSSLWFLFVFLSLVGNLMYFCALKLADGHINPFVFTVFISVLALIGHMLCLYVYKFVFQQTVTLDFDAQGIWMSVMAGVGIVMLDIALFFAMRHGSATASQLFLSVGTTAAFALVAFFFFKDALTLSKIVGIILGVVALFLMVKG